MSREEKLQRARLAESLLDNAVYNEAIETVRKAIIDQWESCPVRDIDGQHELKLMLKLLGDLTTNIRTVMQTGELAKIEIEREKKFSLRGIIG